MNVLYLGVGIQSWPKSERCYSVTGTQSARTVILLLQSDMAFYSYLFIAVYASRAIYTTYLEEYIVLINSGDRHQA